MLIDCDRCEVRGAACADCVVTVLLGSPPEGVVLDPAEQEAIGVLAEAGLVPPLRLVVEAERSDSPLRHPQQEGIPPRKQARGRQVG